MKQIYMVTYEYNTTDSFKRNIHYCDSNDAARKLFTRQVNQLLGSHPGTKLIRYEDIALGISWWKYKDCTLTQVGPQDSGTIMIVKEENAFSMQYMPLGDFDKFEITQASLWSVDDM